MSLSAIISQAITKNLLGKLPAKVAEQFEIDEDEFTEFLTEFLSTQLGKVKGKKSSTRPKGKNGKGSITGYILFSMKKRDGVKKTNPDLKFTGKKLGKMWQKLSEKQKNDWKQKAQKHNTENGLTPSAKRTATSNAKEKNCNIQCKGKNNGYQEKNCCLSQK